MNNRQVIRLAVTLIVVLALLLAYEHQKNSKWIRCLAVHSGHSDLRSDLLKAFGRHCSWTGRLYGGGEVIPCSTSANDGSHKDRVRLVWLHIQRELGGDRSPEALDIRAVARLLDDKAGEAVDLLKEAVVSAPDNFRFWNDLSVAYLARSVRKSGIDLRDIVLALDAADRALKENPASLESAFNKSLALQALFINFEAVKSWESYASIDKKSDWSKEALRRLSYLRRHSNVGILWEHSRESLIQAVNQGNYIALDHAVGKFSQESRRYGEDRLGVWAEQYLRGDMHEAEHALLMARQIGISLQKFNSDSLLSDGVKFVDKYYARAPASKKLLNLAQGHKAFRAGFSLYEAGDVEDACNKFRYSEKLLNREGSPFRFWAQFYVAVCEYEDSSFGNAINLLEKLCRVVDHQHVDLIGRCYWMMGMSYLSQAQPVASLDAYKNALARFDLIGATEDSGAIHHLLAENYSYLGEDTNAWIHRRQALYCLQRTLNGRRVYSVLDEVADAIEKFGKPNVSLYVKNELVQVAEKQGDPVGRAFALLRRAVTYAQLHDENGARRDLNAARKCTYMIADKVALAKQKAFAQLVESEVGDYSAQAGDNLQDTIAHYERGNHFFLARAYRAQARVYQDKGEIGRAIDSLSLALREYEKQREIIRDEGLRISFYRKARLILDDLISLEVDRGSPGEGFKYLEEAHARTLLERLPGKSAGSSQGLSAILPSVEHVANRLPENAILVSYASLQDELLVWIVRHDGARLLRCPVSAQSLLRSVRSFRQAIMNRRSSSILLASAIYQQIFKPILPYLSPGAKLIIVPDRALNNIPFCGLYDMRRARFLVEDYSTIVAPSAAVYLKTLALEKRVRGRWGKGVLVISPRINGSSYPALSDLSAARVEAEAIIRTYPKGRIVMGEEATKASFSKYVGQYEVVHFNGHAIVNKEFPQFSELLFTPERMDPFGVLYAHELGRINFQGTHTLVLASCGAAEGRVDDAEGLLSLARGFLAEGVPSVVASLWDVRDAGANRLMVNFHRALVSGETPADALQRAQVVALHNSVAMDKGLFDWAGFQVIGGGL